VGLVGPLGAGKTRLVQAIAAAAGVVDQPVNSPTFTLVHEYEGRWPIRHFDTYRLSDADQLLALGFDEYLGGESVCLVEWANRVADVLPPDAIWITITPIDDSTRRFDFHATTDKGKSAIASLLNATKRDA
jgi:tRNA threonylcarbamoyladenosine biosynthesis protein TsaE